MSTTTTPARGVTVKLSLAEEAELIRMADTANVSPEVFLRNLFLKASAATEARIVRAAQTGAQRRAAEEDRRWDRQHAGGQRP